MKLGLMTLGDLMEDPVTGTTMLPVDRYRMLIDAAVIADEAGFHSGQRWGASRARVRDLITTRCCWRR